jgi:uncharacterized protein
MNRKSFVLSWGRKMFFGLVWPLLCLISLSYFQNHIIPSSPLEIFYFLVTLIGHYGLITTLIYFLLYVPLVSLFPYYYLTRLWFMVLMIGAGVLIFIDSLVFSLYNIHINGFILTLALESALSDILSPQVSFYIVAATIFSTLIVYIWFRGEKIWRRMQRHFKNPNKNWYFLLIFVCLVLSHALHIYSDAFGKQKVKRHAQIFPLYFPATARGVFKNAGLIFEKFDFREKIAGNFNYPLEQMLCPGGDDKNILFLTVNNWKKGEIGIEKTPLLTHYKDHAVLFNEHHSGGTDVKSAIFSIFYGLSALHHRAAFMEQTSPVFFDELQRRKFAFGLFSEFAFKDTELEHTVFVNLHVPKSFENINEQWKIWLETHLLRDTENPFFGFLAFESSDGIDAKISEILEGLHAKGLSNDTIIFITGSYAGILPDKIQVPLLLIWPGVRGKQVNMMTSHYDIVPTLMSEQWNCQGPISNYSDGESLFKAESRDWFLIGDHTEYQIIDYLKRHIITVKPSTGYSVTDFDLRLVPNVEARRSLILSVLQEQTRFSKKRRF